MSMATDAAELLLNGDGIPRLEFGRALYETKRRRGARFRRAYLAYRPRSRFAASLARSLFALSSRWTEHKLPPRVRLDGSVG